MRIDRGKRAAVAPAHHVPAPEVRGVHVLLVTKAAEGEIVAIQTQPPLHPFAHWPPVTRAMTCKNHLLLFRIPLPFRTKSSGQRAFSFLPGPGFVA